MKNNETFAELSSALLKIKNLDSPIENVAVGPRKRGELAKQILFLIAGGIIVPASFAIPNLPILLKPILKLVSKKWPVTKNNFIKSVTYLKRQRLVSVIEKDDQQIMILSEQGQRRVLQFNLDNMAIKKPKKWDGLWRLVIFDIPEEYRQGRDALRDRLKHLGFYQLQKSCFVYPYQCKQEIDFVTEIFQISQYVNFIITKSIEGQKHLKNFFGLSDY